MPPKPAQKPIPLHLYTNPDGEMACAHCNDELQPHQLGMLWRNPQADSWFPICWKCTKGIASILLLTTDLATSDISIAVI